MGQDTWKPKQYERFKDERRQPFIDLLSLVQPEKTMRVVDLGCGTGELTRLLHQRLQAAHTLGIDASSAMLAKARSFEGPGLQFSLQDIATFRPDSPVDLVFSNAALQWLPAHRGLFASLAESLAQRGQLAVQMPFQQDQPTHLLAQQLGQEPEFSPQLSGPGPQSWMLKVEEYARLLSQLGFTEQHVRLQVYGHLLPDRESVLEWVQGSLLTWYEERLGPALYAQFLARYRELLMGQLEDARPYFFPFKRLLLWARR